jgi:hypothetical protein
MKIHTDSFFLILILRARLRYRLNALAWEAAMLN